MDEILRRFVPQNEVDQGPVISSEARNPYDDSLEGFFCRTVLIISLER